MNDSGLIRELTYYKRQLDDLAAARVTTEHRQWVLQAQLRQKRQGFQLLSKLARSMGAQSDAATMFRTTALAINAELGMDRTVVLVPAEAPGSYVPAHFAGFPEEAVARLSIARFALDAELEADGLVAAGPFGHA